MRGQRRIETGNRGGGALEAGGAIARRQVGANSWVVAAEHRQR
jgi:hypothetical protein